MLSFAKDFLVPGSMGFMLFGLAAGVALLYVQATNRWGRRWLTALLALYLVLAMPWVSGLLQRGTPSQEPPIARADQAQGVRTIVVLGNGVVTFGPPGRAIDLPARNTTYNVLEAVRLYRLLPGARIIASGGMPPDGASRRPEGEVITEHLLRLGVPADDILLERTAVNTHQQAVNVARMLPRGARCLLVTVPSHMPRSLLVFRSQGLDPVPAPSTWGARAVEPDGFAWTDLVPARWALRTSETAIYEWLGVVYYTAQGRIGGRQG